MMWLRFPIMSEHEGKWVLFARLVTEMECRKCLSCFHEGVEIRSEWDARQLFRQIVCKRFPIAWSIQNAVNVIENRILRDRLVTIVFLKGTQRRVRNIVDTIRRLFNSWKFVRRVRCIRRLRIALPRKALGTGFGKV